VASPAAARMSPASQGSAWRGRAEHYLTDPSQEPDPAKLETDVAFLIREA
jgi:hypothetical protein